MMRRNLILILILFSLSVSAQEINWMTFEEAFEAQKNEPRKIMVDAYTSWCGPCKLLDKNTFQNKDVADYINQNYYAIKFNAEGNETIVFKDNTYTNPEFDPNKKGRNSSHQLAGYFSVKAYPTILFLDEESNFIVPLPGYKTPQQLELYLKLFKTDAYKSLNTKEEWDAYTTNFKYEFN